MDILENPLELCGFAFIEFVSKENELDPIFALYTTNFTEPLSYQDSAFLKLPKFP